jgi:putative tryptophan/tyrosine transport system substrate-binding protein
MLLPPSWLGQQMQFDRLNRRGFVTLLGGGAATWPLAVSAQQGGGLPRVVYAGQPLRQDEPDARDRLSAFRMAFEKKGWVDGQNVRIDYSFNGIAPEGHQAIAAEIVRSAPAVVFSTGTPLTAALRLETRTIPVVFTAVFDPQGSGLVDSMMRPAGNLTGLANYLFSMGGKWLEMLKEAAPGTKRVLVLVLPGNRAHQGCLRVIETAAATLGITPVQAAVRDGPEIENAIETFASEPAGGLLALPGPPGLNHSELIIALAARHRLPAMYTHRFFTTVGGLMSYDTEIADLYRRAAFYVDRILKGVSAGELPVQLPTKYDLVVNLKVAKALGLTVPLPLLAQADEVIE